MSRWPDFIIIGAMKCATSTLHEQLALQPAIFMSEPKEPNFFSNDEEYSRGPAWYQGVFNNAPPTSLCGESSTHYTKLPTYPLTIERIRKHLPPTVKFIYIMRHPIDRLVSQYIHEWTQRLVDVPITVAPAMGPSRPTTRPTSIAPGRTTIATAIACSPLRISNGVLAAGGASGANATAT